MELGALERVNDSAEAAATHLRRFSASVDRTVARLGDLGTVLAALKPYAPVGMRAGLDAATLGVLDALEDLGEAATDVVTDYAECLLLAQAFAVQLTSDGKELT